VSADCATAICAAIAVPGEIVKIHRRKKEQARFEAIGNEKAEPLFSQLLDLTEDRTPEGARV
jgi:hypothetical protein